MIKRFIKGIFNLTPPQPRYAEIWDVSIVFRFIDEWGHNEHLSLKKLTIKTATILLLLTGERINTLPSFDIKNMIIDEHKYVFIPSKLLKHSRQCYVNKQKKKKQKSAKKTTLPMKKQHSSLHMENHLRQLMKTEYLVGLRK